MAREQVPVVIVGGGSVGLSAALFLARQGIAACVVERRAGLSSHPRATGLGVRSVELFRQAGIEPAVIAASAGARSGPRGRYWAADLAELASAKSHLEKPAGKEMLALAETVSPCRMGLCAQDMLDPVLLRGAMERGAAVRFGTELVSLEQDRHGVEVRIREVEGGAEHQLHARYVIAADGAWSPVRQQLGIATDGPGALGGPIVNILFRANLAPHLGDKTFALCEFTRPEARGLLVATGDPERWLFHAAQSSDREPREIPPDEWCVEQIRRALGVESLQIEVLSALPWQVNARVAQRFQVGRVFLAGDAAHTVPPLGAFGMNTGIADAHNLAWKLAAVLQGRAGPGLLESYDTERRAVAAFTLSQALLRLKNPDLHWDPAQVAERARAGAANAMVVHLGYRYASRAIVGAVAELPSLEDLERDLDGAPGSRLPHAWIARAGQRISSLDLVRSRFTLIAGHEGHAWRAAAAGVASRMTLPLDTHILDAADATFAERIGIGASGALLVRPDHFVAWRSPDWSEHAAAQLEQVLAGILDRPGSEAAGDTATG